MSITIGIGKNLKITPTPTPPSLDPDISVYISGLVTELTGNQIARLETMVVGIKSALGISRLYEAFDIFYVLAGETQESSLRNLIRRSHDCTAILAPAWVQYEGFTSDGSTNYLDTNFNSLVDSIIYTLNDASSFIYIRTDVNEARIDYGQTSGPENYFGSRYTNISITRINDNNNLAFANLSATGFYLTNRTAANSHILIYIF